MSKCPGVSDSTILKVTGILGLTILAVTALSKGIDGTILMAIAAAIGGIVGYSAKTVVQNVDKLAKGNE